jgi:hypothetical protein
LYGTIAGLLPALWLGSGGAGELQLSGKTGDLKIKPIVKPLDKPSEESTCGSYGTSVHFVKTPSEAAKQAKKEEKLVFVLHVSGHFEDSDFT